MIGKIKLSLAKSLQRISNAYIILSDLIKGVQACITVWEFVGGKLGGIK